LFTGIIEELGTVDSLVKQTAGARLRVQCMRVLEDLKQGSSIAVNGVCLTAVELGRGFFGADLAPETLRRSNLGDLAAGSRVNLERPLSPTDRLSGHIVQGHVDGTGELLSLEELGDDNWWLRVEAPAELEKYLVFKGSISIDGISLTIAEVEGPVIAVTIIPHTYRNTNLHTRRPGDRVNLETDILAKYVEKMFASLELKKPLTVERLREQGF
jgi:riboflavin synthase